MDSRIYKAILMSTIATIGEMDQGVVNGHLYANLMGKMPFDAYCRMIAALKNANLITESGHVLRATPSGKATADKINKALADAKVA